MRKKIFLFILVFIVFYITSCSASKLPKNKDIDLTQLGVNFWYVESTAKDERMILFDLIKDLNISYLRIGGLWYDAHGIKDYVLKEFFTLVNLTGATPIVQIPFNRATVEDMKSFISKIRSIYTKNNIIWEIGNEMDIYADLNFYWLEKISRKEAFNKYQLFLEKLIQLEKNPHIIGPDFSWKWRPWYDKSINWMDEYLEKFEKYLCCISIHRYPFQAAKSVKEIMNDLENFSNEIRKLKRYLKKPIFLTEFNLTWDWTYKGEFDGKSYWAGFWTLNIIGRASVEGIKSVIFWSMVNDKTLSLIDINGKNYRLAPTYMALKFWSDFGKKIADYHLSRDLDWYVSEETQNKRTVIIINKSNKLKTLKLPYIEEEMKIPRYSAIKVYLKAHKPYKITYFTFSK